MKKVFLVHGWSVKETTTYQALHLKLAENGFELQDIYLGRYVSLDDHVEIRDISKALHNALKKELGTTWTDDFHIITHSTGALVVKHWVVHHYNGSFASNKSLKNVVFLAGPHFGSRLAHHGRSMLAHIKYLGDSGKKVLNALELGSSFSWEITEKWFDPENWKSKGIRPFNLIGDRVVRNRFNERILPAAYEKGSDMVVRVAAANLNCKRFELSSQTGKMKQVGEIRGIPFGALSNYIHSGSKCGILNSIKKSSSLQNQNLKLIVECLAVTNAAGYKTIAETLAQATQATRQKRQGFAQIDFQFRDQDGAPVTDYLFQLGAIKNGKRVASKTIADTHKNKVTPQHFTVFINLKELEPELEYFIEIDSRSSTTLYSMEPESFVVQARSQTVTEFICVDQTTQIDVILKREPDRNLFVFHKGTDENLHVEWNRSGKIVKKGIQIK